MQANTGMHSCILQYYCFSLFALALFGALLDPADFRSMIGVSSKASIPSIVTIPSFTERILQVVIAIRLGRTGECVAKTPVNGFLLSPLGWTLRIFRL